MVKYCQHATAVITMKKASIRYAEPISKLSSDEEETSCLLDIEYDCQPVTIQHALTNKNIPYNFDEEQCSEISSARSVHQEE